MQRDSPGLVKDGKEQSSNNPNQLQAIISSNTEEEGCQMAGMVEEITLHNKPVTNLLAFLDKQEIIAKQDSSSRADKLIDDNDVEKRDS